MINNIPSIASFKELLNEICWSYDYPRYDFLKHSDGSYTLNKLYITHDRVSYKMDNWYLEPGIFEEFELFYKLIQGEEPKHD